MKQESVFGLFDNGRPITHLLVLSAGPAIWPLVFVTNRSQSLVAVGEPELSFVAATFAGVYYGLAYAAAYGSPTWNVMLPGLAIEIGSGVLNTVGLTPTIEAAPGLVSTLLSYLGVIGVVAVWHFHLGAGLEMWVKKYFPAGLVAWYEEREWVR